MFKKTLLLFYALIVCWAADAQSSKPKQKGWHLLNLPQDGYLGTDVKEAYSLLKNRKSKTVIIAVIDSGIDTAHEDLTPVLWTNKNEIPGNNRDDDHNGYTDDVHGWNFCGAPNGENLATNTHEITRVYHRWKNQFAGKTENNISKDRLFLFHQWKRSDSILNIQYQEYQSNFENVDQLVTLFQNTSTSITSYLNRKNFTQRDIASMHNNPDSLATAITVWTNIFNRANDSSVTNTTVLSDIEGYKNNLLNNKKRREEVPQDYRGEVVKDDYENISDSIYGNNNLTTGSGNHGTHVAGIIGAAHNDIGVDGIVPNVRIMAIRAVPGGDEHDKDVALAIRYAVNNGAQIINMSFGKPVSPYKKLVDDAIKYAAAKGVLLVHGAGNDGENLDQNPFYPNAHFLDGAQADNMLTIGASGDYSTGNLVASFSNYGEKTVDIFAPGVYINSTITGNGYDAYDGTSMASPVAAGVAGLLKSYFPQLTPKQIIALILQSGTEVKEEVALPGTENKKVSMKTLCKSGKIINAYEAVKLALKLYK